MNARTSVGTILIGLSAPFALGAGNASAQAIYRCGDNSYSQQPCEGGRPVRADDPRTPQQQTDSIAATRREAAMADAMEQSRLQRQAQAERALTAAERPVAAQRAAAPAADTLKQPSKRPSKSKTQHRPEVFVASVPGAKKNAKDAAKPKSKDSETKPRG
jgi:hypothetical protein